MDLTNLDSKILVANYSLLSTGVNIKSLRYMIFASPMVSKITLTQSIGRGIRTHENKDEFDVIDIVDMFEDMNTFANKFNTRKREVYKDVVREYKIKNVSIDS